jgi:hypothetical protein
MSTNVGLSDNQLILFIQEPLFCSWKINSKHYFYLYYKPLQN